MGLPMDRTFGYWPAFRWLFWRSDAQVSNAKARWNIGGQLIFTHKLPLKFLLKIKHF